MAEDLDDETTDGKLVVRSVLSRMHSMSFCGGFILICLSLPLLDTPFSSTFMAPYSTNTAADNHSYPKVPPWASPPGGMGGRVPPVQNSGGCPPEIEIFKGKFLNMRRKFLDLLVFSKKCVKSE